MTREEAQEALNMAAVDAWIRRDSDSMLLLGRAVLQATACGVLRAAPASRTEETPAGPICTWDVRVTCPVPADVAIDCSTSCPLPRRAAEPNGSAEGGAGSTGGTT